MTRHLPECTDSERRKGGMRRCWCTELVRLGGEPVPTAREWRTRRRHAVRQARLREAITHTIAAAFHVPAHMLEPRTIATARAARRLQLIRNRAARKARR